MKKLNKLFIALFLVVLVFLSTISATAKTYETAEISLLQAGDFDIDYVGYHKSSSSVSTLDVNMNDQERRLEQDIYNSLMSVSSEINFSWGEGLNMAWAKTMMSDVINDHPELFYVSTNFDTESQLGRIVKIKPKYSMSSSEIASAKVIFNNGVQKALSIVDSSMDDLQKALVIHDYMCDNSYYNENGHVSHSAYGFFKDGRVVCAGYTLAYSYIMNKLGVECEYVTSLEMNHAWNVIKINGKWYNVDLTYDNEIRSVCPSQNRFVYGVTRHEHFLKSDSDETFASIHHGRDTFDDCDANSTTYDTAFWDDCYTNIVVKDGYYYYLKTNNSYKSATLIKRSKTGTEQQFCSRTFYYVDENTINTNGYKEQFLRLAMINGNLVVAAGDSNSNRYIYMVDKKGNLYYLRSLTTYPVGLTVKNNKIVYQLNDLNEQTLDKMSYFQSGYTTARGKEYHPYPDVDNNEYVNAKDYIKISKGGK